MPDNAKRTVVVTGGSRGIGRAICVALAGPDAHVYFSYATAKTAADETTEAIVAAGGSATTACVDVASEEAVNIFIRDIKTEAGRIDVLVNNAGITRDGLIAIMKEKDWDDVIDTNLKGAFHCTRAVAKTMIKQRYGRIINISSVVGVIGNPGQASYVASKAGIIGLTKSVAKELAPRSITVNAVAPGYVDTDMTAALPEKAKTAMLDQIPLRRAGTPEDVAAVVEFLVSDRASYITGQVIHVSGGMFI